jgi:hypothetical protein
MSRKLNHIRPLRIALALLLAIGLGAARSEKIWVQSLEGLPADQTGISLPSRGHAPFDPRRVPQSGGMASRLLSGITVKHA